LRPKVGAFSHEIGSKNMGVKINENVVRDMKKIIKKDCFNLPRRYIFIDERKGNGGGKRLEIWKSDETSKKAPTRLSRKSRGGRWGMTGHLLGGGVQGGLLSEDVA